MLVVDLDAERLKLVVSDITAGGWTAQAVVADVTDEQSVIDFFAQARSPSTSGTRPSVRT